MRIINAFFKVALKPPLNHMLQFLSTLLVGAIFQIVESHTLSTTIHIYGKTFVIFSINNDMRASFAFTLSVYACISHSSVDISADIAIGEPPRMVPLRVDNVLLILHAPQRQRHVCINHIEKESMLNAVVNSMF